MNHNELWKALKEMGIPESYLSSEESVCRSRSNRILHETTDWFKIDKGVQQGCLLSFCLFNLYTEHIMKNARLDELQAGIKIGGRNINNLRYVDDTALLAESEAELQSLLMRVKERVKEPA